MGYQMDALGHDLSDGFLDHDLHDDVFAPDPADVAMRSPGVAEHVSGHLFQLLLHDVASTHTHTQRETQTRTHTHTYTDKGQRNLHQ